ncbi:hypothetical protein BU26DRAFT_428436 [Trematosphaeria pertusa]|uniref:Ent-kaurene synthase n=1 Tax=Trematosphaeria pertusa TaxID=390896 RepID=A0A6A6IDP2_9PLEO|nr:uncharacterized protein BU26DRAFT_428436 [Trematosphaeria pertusa]KAF2248178.1 hypothetical protein BU26DRAFT_428436 [Trematosphaeria pertusa]
MNASEWDDEAEAYLRMVCEQQSSSGYNGGFPSAFPSTIFEISWVLDTILESGFDKDEFLLADIRKLTVLLEANLKQEKGIVGWERNASSSANCNVLSCLLKTTQPARYTKQIVKCASFLSKSWMRNNGPDKWHTSVQYPMMLTAQAFMLLLKRWAKNELDTDAVPSKLIRQDVPRTLLDILGRTMRSQEADGSWESKREVTAYAVLTLAPLLSLPWIDFLKPEGIACMYQGKAYLENNRHRWRDAERIWIEKTVYGSPNLSQAYCLAASKVVVPTSFMSAKISDIFPAQLSKKMAKMSGCFSRVEPFSRAPKWKLQLSLLQSTNYAAALKACRLNIFPSLEKACDEKYQEYIPFTWVGCRDFLSTRIPAETLWEMMLNTMYNSQVDAYMEKVVWEQYRDRLPELKAFIRSLCSGNPEKRKRRDEGEVRGTPKKVLGPNGVSDSQPNGASNGEANGHTDSALDGTTDGNGATQAPVEKGNSVEEVLTRFVNFALQHPKVQQSPTPLRAWLAHELQTFLLAHITYMEDCGTLSDSSATSKGSLTWGKPRTTFFNWVRTTSADHTSCPYSWVFFLCLIGESSQPVMRNLHQRYALEDGCRHLATMCRQYNDFGSVVRDQEGKTLNSVNFPEFAANEAGEAVGIRELSERRKRDLLTVAEYERRCLERVLGELELSLDPGVMEKVRLFVQVTDVYGQIYVARDIGIRRAEDSKAARAKVCMA